MKFCLIPSRRVVGLAASLIRSMLLNIQSALQLSIVSLKKKKKKKAPVTISLNFITCHTEDAGLAMLSEHLLVVGIVAKRNAEWYNLPPPPSKDSQQLFATVLLPLKN